MIQWRTGKPEGSIIIAKILHEIDFFNYYDVLYRDEEYEGFHHNNIGGIVSINLIEG